MSLSVDTVFVWVSDIDTSIGWYRNLGIDAATRFGDWQTMEVSGETRFALHEGTRPEGGPTAAIAFRVNDLDVEIERLGKRGIIPIESITDTGTARFATFEDPDSNQIQLLQRED